MIEKLCKHARRGDCEECAEEKRERERKRSTSGKAAKRIRGHKGVELRAAVRRRFGHRCAAIRNGVRCNGRIGLQIHHVDGNPANNDPDNLVPVCGKPCHQEFDGKPREAFAQPEPTVFIRT